MEVNMNGIINVSDKHALIKKILLLVFFFVFNISATFAQNIWTTVRNNEVRTISMNSVKSEVMNICNQYDWIYFDWGSENNYISRTRYQSTREAALMLFGSNWGPAARMESDQVIRWLNNNQKFVFATSSIGLGTLVTFVLGNEVIIVTFANMNPMGLGFSTRNRDNRRWLEELMDDIL